MIEASVLLRTYDRLGVSIPHASSRPMRALRLLAIALAAAAALSSCGKRAPLDIPPPPPAEDESAG
ncbi:MAG: hypothetical protein V2I43_13440 [Parvularcula sp.]|nr:hypothetical protein [Parvularcula sp.]